MYNDVVQQGVPDRFAELVAKLEPTGKNVAPADKK
jgi:Anti-sigma factor NepR